MFNSIKPDSRYPSVSAPDSAVKSGPDLSATQREMVYTAFKDTVRITGVPPEFLGCECSQGLDANKVSRVQVCLVYKKWSGQMLRYSMAFQHQMRTCLDRYEPNMDHSAYEWLWKYGRDCDNPFPHMPSPQEWARKKAEAAPPPPPTDFFERRKVPRAPKGTP